MDAPLPGYLYFDEELHGGHYFIIGPDDPCDLNNVIVFCCTSKGHNRPELHGCHSNHELPSFHLEVGTTTALLLPTWVNLDKVYFYVKSDFNTKWRWAKVKLDISLTIDLLKCAGQSTAIAKFDSNACSAEAGSLESAQ